MIKEKLQLIDRSSKIKSMMNIAISCIDIRSSRRPDCETVLFDMKWKTKLEKFYKKELIEIFEKEFSNDLKNDVIIKLLEKALQADNFESLPGFSNPI